MHLLEVVRTEEVKEMEEFLQIVLQRRTSQEKLVANLVVTQDTEKLKLQKCLIQKSRHHKLDAC